MWPTMINRKLDGLHLSGEDGKDAVSAGWNLLQFKLECCGVEDYNDWNQSTWYEGDPTVQGITQVQEIFSSKPHPPPKKKQNYILSLKYNLN